MRKWIGVIGSIYLSCSLAIAGEISVAMITDVKGDCKNITEKLPTDLEILSELFTDNQISVGKDASMTIVYWDAYKEFRIHGPAVIRVLAASLESISGNQPEVRKDQQQNQIRINPAEVTQAGLVMRSATREKPIELLNLRDTKCVETAPLFLWKLKDRVSRVRFELIDEGGHVLLVKVLDGEAFKLPDSVKLDVGMTYSWSVEGRVDSGQLFADWGDFELATPALVEQVQRLRPRAKAPFSSRLLYAGWLQQEGFIDDAYLLWQQLAKERPDSALLKKMAGQ